MKLRPLAALVGSHSLAVGKKATASNVFQGMAEFGADKAFDGNSETRWATDSGTKSAWLEVDLGKPATIGRAVIEQAFPELKRVRKFAIEYWQDNEWKPCYRGENLGRLARCHVHSGHRPARAVEHHRSHRWTDHLGVRVVSGKEVSNRSL